MPLAKHLDALQGRGSADGLSPKYLQILRAALTSPKPSVLLDPLRAKFREKKLTGADIAPWQQVLWRFANVGHIDKENGPKAWQERVTPLLPLHGMHVKLTADRDVALYLTTTDAGDGSADDDVIWENPRLVAPGRPDLPISGLPALVKHLEAQRTKIIASTEKYLNAIATGRDDPDPALMTAWREYLGYGTTKLEPLLTKQMKRTPDYNFIKDWQGDQALSVMANSSDATVRTPGVMKAHSIATYPSPTRTPVIAWKCEKAATLRIHGDVADAHPECGNGVTWALEVLRGYTSEVLAKGETKGANVFKVGPFENVRVESGHVFALVIGPRDGSHVCDLTAINLTLNDGQTTWDLAKDFSPNILKGNPHGAWHFLSQPATLEAAPDVPAPIAEWRKKPSAELAVKVRQFLENDFPLNSPLLRPFIHDSSKAKEWAQKNPSEHSPAPILQPTSDWHRVDQIRSQGRGGILGFAATLAKQAGASRNSAILRGTWLTEVVLGEKLPPPPEEAPANLTERQLIERHSRDENCMGCHKRIAPLGFALEGFDAIGRARKADTKTVLPDGTAVDGLNDLRDDLLTKRRDDFTRQFCRKLLG